jgi:hypothetical protein
VMNQMEELGIEIIPPRGWARAPQANPPATRRTQWKSFVLAPPG